MQSLPFSGGYIYFLCCREWFPLTPEDTFRATIKQLEDAGIWKLYFEKDWKHDEVRYYENHTAVIFVFKVLK